MNLLVPVLGIGLLALAFGKKASASNQLPAPSQPIAPKPSIASTTTIREGSSGPMVVELQARLNEYGADPALETDGIFDAEVTEAVKRFQRTHLDTSGRTLQVDGIVGPKTWGALAAG